MLQELLWILWALVQIGFYAILLLLALVVIRQDRILYHPQAPTRVWNASRPEDFPAHGNWSRFRSPRYYQLDYETIWIETADKNRLQAWLLHCPRRNIDEVPTIIFLHGNAGHIGLRLPFFHHVMKSVDCNILALEFRGFGNSSGRPTEKGLIQDAQAALLYLHERDDINEVFLFGRSLGGAVATAAAASAIAEETGLKGLILENTFLSIQDMVSTIINKIVWLNLGDIYDTDFVDYVGNIMMKVIKPFIWLRWKTKNRIAQVRVPILFLSGRIDDLVPPFHMDSLYQIATAEGKTFHNFEYGDHNHTWQEFGYREAITAFLEKII